MKTPEDFDKLLTEMYEQGGNPEWTLHVHPTTGEQVEVNWVALDEAGKAEAVKALRDGGYIE